MSTGEALSRTHNGEPPKAKTKTPKLKTSSRIRGCELQNLFQFTGEDSWPRAYGEPNHSVTTLAPVRLVTGPLLLVLDPHTEHL
jgi:hypothetical protein